MSAPGTGLRIDRCVCQGRLFSDLHQAAHREGWDLARLTAATGCGAQCGLCRPYLRRMLETGETVFTAVLTEPASP